MNSYILNIRPKRQTTLPETLLQALNLDIGDKLKAEVKDNRIILTPQKKVALDAFSEIQKLFQESGVTEEETLNDLKMIRKEIHAKKAS